MMCHFPTAGPPTAARPGMNLLEATARFLRGQSHVVLFAEVLVLVAFIGFIDYITGYEVPIYPFYAIPILLSVWFIGRRATAVISVICGLVWWWADVAAGHQYSSEWLRYWDGGVRLMMFCLMGFAGTTFKQHRDAIRARVELLERSQRLEHEIISISERERQSIGRDLHDGMCQYLAAIGFTADLLRQDLAREAHGRAETAGEIARLVQDALRRVREVARGLSPVERDEGGLELALDELARTTSHLTGITCTFLGQEPVGVPDSILAIHLFRIAQEAIANATRHGHAKAIIIALEATGGELSLRVSDDGVGFDPACGHGGGMGLNTMRYRARVIGGALEIYPNTPSGTVVSCTVGERMKAEG